MLCTRNNHASTRTTCTGWRTSRQTYRMCRLSRKQESRQRAKRELRHYSRLARWAGVVCGFWRTRLASNNDSNPSRPLDCIGTCVGRKIVRYSVQTSTRFALEHTHWPQSIIMPSTTLTRPRAGGNIAHWVWLGGHESQVRCYASQYFFKAA